MTLLLLTFSILLASISADVPGDFQESQIVPDVIPIAPEDEAHVTYKKGFDVNLGNEATPGEVQTAPRVSWPAEKKSLYSLFMIDPDAPSRESPSMHEFLHWMVVNIPGSKVAKGDTLIDYFPPTPPPGTGPHRYVFLVYKQQDEIDDSAAPTKRAGFSVSQFAQQHNLGNPVAGNFFMAQR
ncbi:hypothetical protein QR680_010160 [Steinernema hermaphroditum]|uniref:Phosphatidylethanolamine-binding protein n=1 Tax=Steinernema hermaphroditum TaxID=289476 RepID=A0AA39MA65_9BILA|nr:hypothetical protein QR680_010160 [Steinernema hermaphroditum]